MSDKIFCKICTKDISNDNGHSVCACIESLASQLKDHDKELKIKTDLCVSQRKLEAQLQGEINNLEDKVLSQSVDISERDLEIKQLKAKQ